ncbi:GAF domain-containing protein [Streptomyces sp. NPDC002730]|uniref:GAF domain-containing protein n=1 Tax=Streptomyces sp. NPDC002730 TaxID=3364662 RepID=UPI0036D068DE
MAVSAARELRRYLLLLGLPGDHLDIARGHVARRCMDSGRPWLANHASDDLMRKVAPIPERVGVYRSAGIHSLLLVPLPTAGRSIGAMLLGRAGASAPFSDEDILTAQGLAARAAVASVHRYTTERTMARELQTALLSEHDSPHLDVGVAACYGAGLSASRRGWSRRGPPCVEGSAARRWAAGACDGAAVTGRFVQPVTAAP